jgi:hypothetical protein
VKNFIGKGKQVNGLDIAKITCKVEDILKYAYEWKGEQFVTFEVAKMKQPDSYGREYTAYVSQKQEVAEPEVKPKSKKAKTKK